MSVRIGADVGGTFTDIVIEVDAGASAPELHSAKILTTHDAPEQGILEGISRAATEAGIDLADVDQRPAPRAASSSTTSTSCSPARWSHATIAWS